MVRTARELLGQAMLLPIAFFVVLVQLGIGIFLFLFGLIAGVLLLLGVDVAGALETSEEVMTPIAEDMWMMRVIETVFSIGKWYELTSIALLDYWFVSVPIVVVLGASFLYELVGLESEKAGFSITTALDILIENLVRHVLTIGQSVLGGAMAMGCLMLIAAALVGLATFSVEVAGESGPSQALAVGFQAVVGIIRNLLLAVWTLLIFLPGFFSRHTEFCWAILFVMGVPGWEVVDRSRRRSPTSR